MTIQITYRKTSRLSMRIAKNGDVHVSAPFGMPKAEIERFIDDYRDWIVEARKKHMRISSDGQHSLISYRYGHKLRPMKLIAVSRH